jgi:hypothetical protein
MNTVFQKAANYITNTKKLIIIATILLIGTSSCKQYAKFETTIHKENATKDGIYLGSFAPIRSFNDFVSFYSFSLDRRKTKPAHYKELSNLKANREQYFPIEIIQKKH